VILTKIEEARVELDHVTIRPSDEHLLPDIRRRRPCGRETHFSQIQHVGLESGQATDRRIVLPELRNQRRHRNHLVEMHEEHGEDVA
jgi:hypothetical protein